MKFVNRNGVADSNVREFGNSRGGLFTCTSSAKPFWIKKILKCLCRYKKGMPGALNVKVKKFNKARINSIVTDSLKVVKCLVI